MQPLSRLDPAVKRLENDLEEAKRALRDLIRLDEESRRGGVVPYAQGSPWARAWDAARRTMRRIGP